MYFRVVGAACSAGACGQVIGGGLPDRQNVPFQDFFFLAPQPTVNDADPAILIPVQCTDKGAVEQSSLWP